MGVVVMDDAFIKNMGLRIFERRKQLNLTQDDIASRTGLALQTISMAELGKTSLRAENILRICMVLDVSADYLLTGDLPDERYKVLNKKVAKLTEAQYRELLNIVHSFLVVCGIDDE